MTRPGGFRQADITRMVKGLKSAGETISGIKILPDGTIVALTGQPDESVATTSDDLRRRIDAFKSGPARQRQRVSR